MAPVVEQSDCVKEYGKNPKLRREDVQQLVDWVEKQAHLPKVTEFMVIQFYVASEYSLLKAKTLIDGHYKFRNEVPELFIGLDFDLERLKMGFLDSWYYIPLSTTDNTSRTIYVGLKHTDASKFSWECFATMLLRAHLTTIFSEGSCDGCNWILDAQGFGFSHLASARIVLLRHVVNYLQSYIPMRIPNIFLVRMNPFAEKFYFLMKQIFNEEMNRKMCFLPSLEKIFEHTPKECVPVDLGGTLSKTRDELNHMQKVRMAILEDVVMEEMSLKSDESKRIGNRVEDLSTNASFKKLQID